jgi:phosphoglycolate phosphatase-like HAD superfamily hydrolase
MIEKRILPILHIAFDLDGTLINTTEIVLESLYAAVPEERRSADLRERLRAEQGGSPLPILRKYGLTNLRSYWREHGQRVRIAKAFPDVAANLNRFAELGVGLSVLTSLPASVGKALLSVHDLHSRFQRVDGSGSLPFRKPSFKALRHHLELLGVAPQEAAYLGDQHSDMQMARAAGVMAIAISWSSANAVMLKPDQADQIVGCLGDLLELAEFRCQT